MKIYPIQNYGYKNLNFRGSTPANVSWRESYEPEQKNNNNDNNKKGLPEWVRKSTLFGLIALAIANDPWTQEYFKSESVKQEEATRNEYFQNVSKMGYTIPAHHLNMLADVDKPVIKSKRNGNYNIVLNLDNNKKVEFYVNTSENGENTLYGYLKPENSHILRYKAVFNPQNPEEFEVFVRNKENQKFVFGRTAKGQLYQVKNGKKVVLNKENVKRYQNELKAQEELDGLEFFTTKNDMWRKLNLILLFLLTLNELGHDMEKRDREKEKYNKK